MKYLTGFGQESSETLSISEAIQQVKLDLESAYSNLNHALDPDLIDCYIYQLKSAQMRYHFLLHCAKKASSSSGHTAGTSR
ncbi:MAG: YaaL family protein [Clostridiales bacterium]|nr:YaaL family protein [Clostridiales bacterium]